MYAFLVHVKVEKKKKKERDTGRLAACIASEASPTLRPAILPVFLMRARSNGAPKKYSPRNETCVAYTAFTHGVRQVCTPFAIGKNLVKCVEKEPQFKSGVLHEGLRTRGWCALNEEEAGSDVFDGQKKENKETMYEK